jgi:hypothetical protein
LVSDVPEAIPSHQEYQRGKEKMRASCSKLYRFACSEQTRRWNEQKGRYDYSYKFLSGRLDTLQEKTEFRVQVGWMNGEE